MTPMRYNTFIKIPGHRDAGNVWRWGDPYESAARVDMEQLASSILAPRLCKGVQFHGDAVIASVAAAMVLIGRKGAEDAFFSAIRANIDDMSAKGREAWCSVTIKAAKQRNSDL